MTASSDDIGELLLPEGVWKVDPQQGEIGFAIKSMWGLQTVRGTFGSYEGSLSGGAEGPNGELKITAASIDSGQAKRDTHLRSADFFDVERYPQIGFATTAIAARDGGLTISGDLTIGSSRARLQIPANVDRLDDGTLRIAGEVAVAPQAVGITWNTLKVMRGDAKLHARLTLRREA